MSIMRAHRCEVVAGEPLRGLGRIEARVDPEAEDLFSGRIVYLDDDGCAIEGLHPHGLAYVVHRGTDVTDVSGVQGLSDVIEDTSWPADVDEDGNTYRRVSLIPAGSTILTTEYDDTQTYNVNTQLTAQGGLVDPGVFTPAAGGTQVVGYVVASPEVGILEYGETDRAILKVQLITANTTA